MRIINAFGLALVAAITAAACSTSGPVYQDERSYEQRAERQVRDGLTVSAAALSAEESRRVFGATLNSVGVQPVWVRIENHNDEPFWLLPLAVDREYFPAYEVARRMSDFSDLSVETLHERLHEKRIETLVTPRSLSSGFIYTHADEGMKAFNIELHGNDNTMTFPFVAPVPGLPSDYFDLDPDKLYTAEQIIDLDQEGLKAWLEDLACCTVDADGRNGDPLNLVFVGSLDQVRRALISRHWDVTAPVTGASLWRTFTAFFFESRYRYAPISTLCALEREHDLAFQKSRAIIDERNHMRLWLAPVTVDGRQVWVGQVSRDVGVKLSGRWWPPTTHVIDIDIDDARFYVVQDLLTGEQLQQVGYVYGQPPSLPESPNVNAEDDPYFSDGLRAVLFLADEPVPMTDVRLLRWRLPAHLEPYRKKLEADPDFWTQLEERHRPQLDTTVRQSLPQSYPVEKRRDPGPGVRLSHQG
ncbi:MAG: LssY C-terminal domain-containing protein [Chromatiales bacterium]|jgi:hypothetical protein